MLKSKSKLTHYENPYVDTGIPELKKSIFVYVDILGYSELIKTNSSNEELINFHQVLASGRDGLEDKELKKQLKGLKNNNDYALKVFTDNIVIGWPISSDGEREFGRSLFKLSYFQSHMVSNGYFLRGAISFDDAYIDEIAVFGPALINAHDGEEKLARDPRIILTQSCVEKVKQFLKKTQNPAWSLHNNCLLCDSDGQWFINYLNILLPDIDVILYDDIFKHRKIVEKQLEKNIENPQVWSKYAWVARYHNYFCSINLEQYECDEYKIDIEKFGASPKSIL